MSLVRHRIFTLASVLSLLMCVATVVLWLRSYWRYDIFILTIANGRTCWLVTTTRGKVQLCIVHDESRSESRFAHGSGVAEELYPLPHTWMGIGWGQRVDLPPWLSGRNAVAVPCSYIVFVLAFAPAMKLLSRLRRRKRTGCCPICHYDLTGNTSGVCPECGTATKIPN